MDKKIQMSCETCGATLKTDAGGGRAVCPYCGRVYMLEKQEKQEKGVRSFLSGLQRRAGIVASNYGFAEGNIASDSFAGDGAEEERRLLAGADVKNGILIQYRARESGEAVRVPGEIATVGKKAAYKDKLVGRVSFATGVTTIGKKSFSHCFQLTYVRLEGVAKLCNKAFEGCVSLREVTINTYIPQIGKKVFAGCKALKRVIMPRSMESNISRLFGSFAKLRIEFVFFD